MAKRRRGRWRWAVALVVLLGAGCAAILAVVSGATTIRPDGCTVTVAGGSYPLDLEQAANAATISAVAQRLGLSDHAVTVALATALQESKLHNLPYGDRDSVGLFQQRPSQGWGPRAALLDPHFAATAFFSHLAHVPGWEAMSVAAAAQAVQRSAGGSAYADWEPAARATAQALTGEAPRAIACFYAKATSSSRGLTSALARDIGSRSLGTAVPVKTGWMTASWLVAQAAQYSIDSVSFNGARWSRATGTWRTSTVPVGVTVTVLPPHGTPASAGA